MLSASALTRVYGGFIKVYMKLFLWHLILHYMKYYSCFISAVKKKGLGSDEWVTLRHAFSCFSEKG